jgi:Transmembrane amino acid transporter protein
MVLFGIVEIVLSQFPNLEEITLISVIAAIMSFAYSFIGLALVAAKFASHGTPQGTILGVRIGVDGISASTKVWHSLQALGNIAFAYTYAMLLIEIQVLFLLIFHSIFLNEDYFLELFNSTYNFLRQVGAYKNNLHFKGLICTSI